MAEVRGRVESVRQEANRAVAVIAPAGAPARNVFVTYALTGSSIEADAAVGWAMADALARAALFGFEVTLGVGAGDEVTSVSLKNA